MSTSGASMTDIAIRVENLSKQYPSAWLRASSSGMYVCLAFALATHRSAAPTTNLEPEILL